MAVFSSKNYETLTRPLKKMATDLATYISEQTNRIDKMNTEKVQILEQARIKTEKIDGEISVSNLEIKKSNHTVMKIQDFLAHDMDESDFPDDDTSPEDPPTEDQ